MSKRASAGASGTASQLDDHLPLGIGLEEAKRWMLGVREWQIDVLNGVVHVGSPDRVLLVGQAPARGADDLPAFSGRSGDRLRRLLGGLPEEDFKARFDAFNVLPRWPGKAGKGDRFPLDVAKAIASRCRLRAGRVLLFGGAAAAFGVGSRFRWVSTDAGLVAGLPHPSGVNRWWNEEANRAEAGAFFAELVESAGAQEGPSW